MLIDMSLLKIIKDTNKNLRKKSLPVNLPLTDEDRLTLQTMLDYIIKSQDTEFITANNIREGIGLAAPQIGISKRLLVIHYHDGENLKEFALANPKIVSSSVKLACLANGEGCLSVDEEHPGYVYRPVKVTIKAFDALTNKEIVMTLRGFDAMVIQHELDHLDGILFYDRINKEEPLKRLNEAEFIGE